jgi:hypothetical protein
MSLHLNTYLPTYLQMGNDAFLREVGRLACELLQKREDHYISHKIMCENEKTKKRSLKQENEDRRQEKLDTGNKKARISMKGVIGKMRSASTGAFDMSNAFGNETFGVRSSLYLSLYLSLSIHIHIEDERELT